MDIDGVADFLAMLKTGGELDDFELVSIDLYDRLTEAKHDPLAWLDEPLTDEERARAGLPLAGE